MAKRLTDNLSSKYYEAYNRLTSKHARKRIIAYVESFDDIYFWRTVLSGFENERIYFEVMLPSRTKLSRGKKSVLKNQLCDKMGEGMIACVDADSGNGETGAGIVARRVVTRLEERLGVFAPGAIYQLEGGKTEDDRLVELTEEHTHKADGLKPLDVAHFGVGFADGDAELIPATIGGLAIGELDILGIVDIYNVIFTDDHVGWVKVNHILVVIFGLTERVVFVDVLHIGQGLGGSGVVLFVVGIGGRVALGVVVVLVTIVDFDIVLVVVAAAVVAEIVATGVGPSLLVGGTSRAVKEGNALKV